MSKSNSISKPKWRLLNVISSHRPLKESFKSKIDFIKEDRKIKLISDVDSQIPDKLKKLLSLIDEIIETDEKTLLLVFKKIEESRESINSIFLVIEYAINIRPLNTTSLTTLICLLSQKHGYRNIRINNDWLYSILLQQGIICKQKNRKEITTQEDEVLTIIKQDDVDSFIKKSSEAGFNPKSMVRVDSGSPITFVENYIKLYYLQIIAFYGAVKCFKHASLNNEYDFGYVEEYAVAGGNMEIVHILEQRNVSFENCLDVSIQFHRNELSDWILMNYKCFELSLSISCLYFNYRAAIFGFINGISIDKALSQVVANDHLEVVKYLYETWNAEVTEETLHNAKGKEIKEYFNSLFSDKPSDYEDSILKAAFRGKLKNIQYLIERYHAKIPVHVKMSSGDVSANDHLDIITPTLKTIKN